MSPVHVIVGEDERAEAMWARAFTGAVDLYRFDRNVDAFERLTAAEAPIDLVVLTPAQRGPFNLTPDQFIARVLEGPLGASRCLANLHVIVVGQPIQRSHPRVMAVSTLDAAIRLVKFGEIERAPRPAVAAAPAAPVTPSSNADVAELLGDLPFAGSVISSIWDAPDRPEAPRSAPVVAEPVVNTPDAGIVGGGAAPSSAAAAPAASPAQPQLFTRVTDSGFVLPREPQPLGAAPAPAGSVDGGGAAQLVGAPGESIEVATGALQPARSYQLPQAGYRGPAVRGGVMHGAAHDAGGQPVPPALVSQVHSMVYGPAIGNPMDPLLVWSSVMREQAPTAGVPSVAAQPVVAQPAPGAQPMPPMHAMPNVPVAHAPVAHAPVVPLEPPAGAYGAPVAPAPAADPFLRRAEQGGNGVAFG